MRAITLTGTRIRMPRSAPRTLTPAMVQVLDPKVAGKWALASAGWGISMAIACSQPADTDRGHQNDHSGELRSRRMTVISMTAPKTRPTDQRDDQGDPEGDAVLHDQQGEEGRSDDARCCRRQS